MLDTNDIFFLAILYFLAYGLGLLVSKFWAWLRYFIILLFGISLYQDYQFKFQNINYKVVLVIFVPCLLFLYPAIKQFYNGHDYTISSIIRRLLFLFATIYSKLRNKIKQYISSRANKDKKNKFDEDKFDSKNYQRKNTSQDNQQNQKEQRKQETSNQSKPKSDPYEVLGVNRDMSFADIKKAYHKLMMSYAPDRVSHLGEEFQRMAHEKCVEFNVAFEKIRRESNM
jgi:hypothetical protein